MNKSAVIDRSQVYDEKIFAKKAAAKKADDVPFAENGKLLFTKIVYPDFLDTVKFDKNNEYENKERYKVELKNSALFLKSALEKMTGDTVELISQSQYDGSKAIILVVDGDKKVSRQGYCLDIDTDSVTISSTFEQGVANGIFSFLEDYLGCMFLAPDCDYIPKLSDIHLSKIHITDEPAFMWRS
ncbi:MAG: hypothetical protein ACI4IQ_07340, partial [Eubacterium sp.]